MTVYHAGTDVITHPLVSVGRPRLDFGRGFYVTNILQQAQTWARRTAQNRQKPPVINVYDFNKEKALKERRIKLFTAYDVEWLEFVVSNRRGGNEWKNYDLIEGGVADDRVIDTVEAYMSEFMTADVALKRLSLHEPNNQICFTRQQAADNYLKFIKTL